MRSFELAKDSMSFKGLAGMLVWLTVCYNILHCKIQRCTARHARGRKLSTLAHTYAATLWP